MVYSNLVWRTSSRLIQQQTLGTASAQHSTVAAAPIRRPASSLVSSSITSRNESDVSQLNNITTTAIRSKHSSTQIKRLFKQNPAKRRIALKQQSTTDEGVIPESTIQPLDADPKFLSNGWSAPIEDAATENYPFQVARTKNKPNNALGFLPVYSEHR